MSPHLGYVCPEVLQVPGPHGDPLAYRQFSERCAGLLRGGYRSRREFRSIHSKSAFDALMAKLQGNDIIAEYHDLTNMISIR